MGVQDRDWYREKQIDWDRGGLRARNEKRRRFTTCLWWTLAAILVLGAAALFRQI